MTSTLTVPIEHNERNINGFNDKLIFSHFMIHIRVSLASNRTWTFNPLLWFKFTVFQELDQSFPTTKQKNSTHSITSSLVRFIQEFSIAFECQSIEHRKCKLAQIERLEKRSRLEIIINFPIQVLEQRIGSMAHVSIGELLFKSLLNEIRYEPLPVLVPFRWLSNFSNCVKHHPQLDDVHIENLWNAINTSSIRSMWNFPPDPFRTPRTIIASAAVISWD